MSRKPWAAALYVLLVFAAGVAAGVMGDRVISGRGVAAKTDGPPAASELRRKHVAEMTSRLHLAPEQITSLNRIMDETRDQYRAARERTRPEMARIFENQVRQITAMLKPEQRPEYERIVEEHDRQRKLREAGANR